MIWRLICRRVAGSGPAGDQVTGKRSWAEPLRLHVPQAPGSPRVSGLSSPGEAHKILFSRCRSAGLVVRMREHSTTERHRQMRAA